MIYKEVWPDRLLFLSRQNHNKQKQIQRLIYDIKITSKSKSIMIFYHSETIL